MSTAYHSHSLYAALYSKYREMTLRDFFLHQALLLAVSEGFSTGRDFDKEEWFLLIE